VITNDVSDYINLLVRIAHIICNHPVHLKLISNFHLRKIERLSSVKAILSILSSNHMVRLAITIIITIITIIITIII